MRVHSSVGECVVRPTGDGVPDKPRGSLHHPRPHGTQATLPRTPRLSRPHMALKQIPTSRVGWEFLMWASKGNPGTAPRSVNGPFTGTDRLVSHSRSGGAEPLVGCAEWPCWPLLALSMEGTRPLLSSVSRPILGVPSAATWMLLVECLRPYFLSGSGRGSEPDRWSGSHAPLEEVRCAPTPPPWADTPAVTGRGHYLSGQGL